MLTLLLGCVPGASFVLGTPAPAADPRSFESPSPLTVPDLAGDPADTDPGTDPGVDAAACSTFTDAVPVGRLPAGLDEVSGLVASRRDPGVLWAIEDSGNAAALYALDLDGRLLATVQVPAPNVDWEDLALAPCGDGDCLWIADTGDNTLTRTDQALYVIPEPPVRDGVATVQQVLPVRYSDGPHNVEALVVGAAGVPTLFSKQDDGATELLRPISGVFGPAATVRVAAPGDDAWASRVTAADLWPGDTALLLRTYGHAWRYELDDRGLFALLDTAPTELAAAPQPQAESAAWDPTLGGWWQTSEGAGADLLFAECGG